MGLRILQVASGLPGWAGTEKQIMDSAPGLARRGHEVTIACQPGSEIERRAVLVGLPTVHLVMRYPHDWKQLPNFVRAMRGRYDVVHIRGYRDYIVPAAAARLARVPVVVMTRHLPHPFRSRFTAYVCSEIFYDGIIAVSDFVAGVMSKSGVNPKRIFVVKNGIDLSYWHPVADNNLRAELGVPPGAFLVVAAGRLSPEKGFDVLLRAMVIAREKGLNAVCAIAGRGQESESLERLRTALGLEQTVHLLGFRSDIRALFAAADVVAAPSVSPETFGHSVLEGLACRRPVIASGIGGFLEIVTSETGCLIPPSDPEALAEAMVELANAPERRQAMGEAGHRRAQEFSLDKCVQGIEAVYITLVRRRLEASRAKPQSSTPCRPN